MQYLDMILTNPKNIIYLHDSNNPKKQKEIYLFALHIRNILNLFDLERGGFERVLNCFRFSGYYSVS